MTAVDVIDFDIIAPRVERVLRKMLGENAAIDLSRGIEGRVRAKVISPKFNGMKEAEKSSIVWDALTNELKDDVRSVSFVVAYGTDEL